MQFRTCVFCESVSVRRFDLKTKRTLRGFSYCADCGGIAVLPEYFLPLQEQRERYLKHRNSLADSGYKRFLCSFLEAVFAFNGGVCVHAASILDYGSGPEPALVQLLRESAAGGAGVRPAALPFLEQTRVVTGWDPFFAPDLPETDRAVAAAVSSSAMPEATDGFDLVTCLEVAEHFEQPQRGFAGIASRCKPGGYAAIGTLPIPADFPIPDGFSSWWYKDDRTHVSFYTEKAIAACGARAGLLYEGMASPRVFMFKKPPA